LGDFGGLIGSTSRLSTNEEAALSSASLTLSVDLKWLWFQKKISTCMYGFGYYLKKHQNSQNK
jgi:hypothetical protein